MRRIALAAAAFALFAQGASAETFRFTAIPDKDQERLVERFGKVADYLEERLGVEVEYVPVKSNSAAVTAFRSDQVQLAWLGGLSGVQRQRVAVGLSLYQERDIFLGDEPVASVDPHQALRLLAPFADLAIHTRDPWAELGRMAMGMAWRSPMPASSPRSMRRFSSRRPVRPAMPFHRAPDACCASSMPSCRWSGRNCSPTPATASSAPCAPACCWA